MTHVLKLNYHFATAVSLGEKNFEIRKNDRGFQKGDYVAFVVVDDDGKPFYDDPKKSCLYNKLFEITYVLNGWGLQKGYVVFGMKQVKPSETFTKDARESVKRLLGKDVVRCKDCKYAIDEYDDGDCYCHRPEREMFRTDGWDHFCAAGKRRSE